MIVCRFSDLMKYESILKNLPNTMNAVEDIRRQGMLPGRYEFDGGFLIVIAETSKPIEDGMFESHDKHVDIQYVVEGMEEIAFVPLGICLLKLPPTMRWKSLRSIIIRTALRYPACR